MEWLRYLSLKSTILNGNTSAPLACMRRSPVEYVNVIHGRAVFMTEPSIFANLREFLLFSRAVFSNILIFFHYSYIKGLYLKKLVCKWPLPHGKKKKSQIKSKSYTDIYNVAKTTLCEWLTGIKPQSETRTNGYKLTPIEEETLVKRLLDTNS